MALNRPLAIPLNARIAVGITNTSYPTSAPPAPEPFERNPNPDIDSDVGYDTSGTAWTIAGGLATNATNGQRLTVTELTSPVTAGLDFTVSITNTANPAGTGWVASLYNSVTTNSQLILSVMDGSIGIQENTGTVDGEYDQLFVIAIDDPGLVLDRISLLA